MKLQYNKTRTVTTADLFIACEPPLEFEIKTNLGGAWARLQLNWEEDGADDVGMACELVGQAVVSVSQFGDTYPVGSKDGAEALQAAIEESSSGEGETFICNLALFLARNHYSFLAENSAKSGKLLPELNGSNAKKRRVKV